MDLESLVITNNVRNEGIYYEVLKRYDDSETRLIVLIFDDCALDKKAEFEKVMVQLRDYGCLTEFKVNISEMFRNFNGRIYRKVVDELIDDEVDLDTLT